MAIDQILQKIISEYQEEKEAILRQAAKEKAEKIKIAKKNIDNRLQSEKVRIGIETERKFDRLYMAHTSSAKLKLNRKKKEALDAVFTELESAVLKLSKGDYQNFVKSFIDLDIIKQTNECWVGSKEKHLDETFISDIVKGSNELQLKFMGNTDKFEHGLLFTGKSYDVNLSFEVIIKSIKEKKMTEIARELFK